ncbi:two component signal transduction response regulator [Candidatus Scalindua japonica]|uniref:Two component signal transduction response regulator n=1 Tax=Candidatus Scalindua japonica TaxID=1284222 RepID=A0A286TYR1_9BACT|nr:response regulator [Candidatus Scalindua japonica]GAX61006.1 two component signal transduction response regulator [Candidatus Scalindua japonica]
MKIKAVVLEDDDSIRSLTCEILKDRGYEVFASSEPFFSPVYLNQECDCPEEYCTTIVITDINMPNMTGLEFIEHQRSMGCKFQNVAVMSGRWTNETLAHANRLGCQTFCKPFKVNEIKKWLDECEERLDHRDKLSNMQRRYN